MKTGQIKFSNEITNKIILSLIKSDLLSISGFLVIGSKTNKKLTNDKNRLS
jgi:hypothetical protein